MKQIIQSSSLIYASILLIFSVLLFSHNQQDNDAFNAPQIIKLTASNEDEENLDADAELDNEGLATEEKNSFIDESLKKALILSREGEHEAAIYLYQVILNENENHQIAATNLALLHKRTLGCEQAKAAIEHAINVTRGKRLAKSLSLQGSCYIEAENYTAAIKSLTRAIEFRPNHALLWKKLAKAQNLSQHPIERVIQTYQRALALDSNNLKLRIRIAKLQYQHLDFNGSIKTLRGDYSNIKTSYEGQYLLAWNYLEVRKFNNAKKHIKIARRLDNAKIDILTAMKFYADKRYNSGINFIKGLKNKTTSYQYLLALNYSGKKWVKSASKYYLKLDLSTSHQFLAKFHSIQLLAPNSKGSDVSHYLKALQQLSQLRVFTPYIAYRGAYAAFNNNLKDEAKNWLEDLALPSKDIKTRLLYSDILWVSNNYVEALKQLNDLHKENPNSPIIIRKYATRLHEKYENLAAIKVFAKLKLSDYKGSDFILNAEILASLKQTNKALMSLVEGTEHWPNNTQLRLLLAKALLADNQYERSKQQIQFVLKLDNTHQAAKNFQQENFNEKSI